MAKRARKRNKQKRNQPPSASSGVPTRGGGGILQSMLGGFRSAVGVGTVEKTKKKTSWSDYLLWAVLIAALFWFLYRRYSQ